MALIMFYEFLIGFTDIYVAGRFGKEIQAAYGLAFQLYFIFIIIGIAFSVGVVSITSRLFTANEKEKFSTAVTSSLTLVSASGIFFSVAGFFFSGTLIRAMHVPVEIKDYASSLTAIYSLGFAFDYVLMTSNGILRSSLMVKKSLWIMSAVCAMNVVLDFVLAFATPMGFNGIAVATVISLGFGCLLSMGYLRRLISGLRFSLSFAREIFNISWPSGLQQIFWQLAALVLYIILSFLPENEVEVMAALTNGLKIESIIFLPAIAFNMANQVVVGNLLGKKEAQNAFRGGLITAILGTAFVSVMTLFVIFNARPIASFLSTNPAVVDESVRYIYIALLSEPFMAWGVILGGGLNGAGDTRSVMLITALSLWLIRLPLSYILGIYMKLGPVAIWWAMNISIIAQTVFVSRRYHSKKWFT